jgi:hypothetical protein
MAGLLSDVLPFLYSQGDRAKRHLSGLIADPLGSIQQTAGGIVDAGRAQQGLLAQAFANPQRPFQVTNEPALAQASQNALQGPLGFAPAGIFAGIGAKTANKAALAQAEKMLAAGDDPARVWAQTGWGRGPDGKMRFEIDDSKAEFVRGFTKPTDEEYRAFLGAHKQIKAHDELKRQAMDSGESLPQFYKARPGAYEDVQAARAAKSGYTTKYLTPRQQSGPLNEFVDHPKLFDAYPDLKRVQTVLGSNNSGGAYTPSVDMIHMGPDNPLSVALHETTHAIQKREGFGQGGGYQDEANGIYERLLGEAEARMVQDRIKMTAQQRAAQYPWATTYFRDATGVPIDSLIFRN